MQLVISASLSINITSVSTTDVDLSPIPSVGRSVCVCVRKVYCGKIDDWIRMPFGMVEWGRSRDGCIRSGGNRRRRRGSFRVNLGCPIATNRDFIA